jgi:hypothetical protein
MLKEWLSRLFGFLLAPFRPRPEDVYFPRERTIYRYWTGKGVRSGDPMVLYKRMMEVGPALSIDIKLAQSQSKDAKKGHDRMISTIRDIFFLDGLDKGGLSEIETAQVLDHFLRFCERIKKKQNPLPTISTPSEDSTPTSEEKPPATEPSSDSGSAEKDPPTGEPVLSPTGSATE